MGRGHNFAAAYAKALIAAGMQLPQSGAAFLSIRNEDKAEILPVARGLRDLGFELWATHSTAEFLNSYDLGAKRINKVQEGDPHCETAIREGRFSLVINTTADEQAIKDSFSMRRAALERKVPYSTVLSAARVMVEAIREERKGPLAILPL
jgi:carbamoyl-phosphate synthase large subunit